MVPRPNIAPQRTPSAAPPSPLSFWTLGSAKRVRSYGALSVGVLISVVGVQHVLSAENVNPCASAVASAAFTAHVALLLKQASALNLLNGREEPRLKRILEIDLLSGIESARRDVESGATISPVSVAVARPSLLDAVGKARRYLLGHKIQRVPGTMEGELKPLDGLAVVEKWLQTQKSLPTR